MRGHFKAINLTTGVDSEGGPINTVVAFTVMISAFPLLFYKIIPSRTGTAYTRIGVVSWRHFRSYFVRSIPVKLLQTRRNYLPDVSQGVL